MYQQYINGKLVEGQGRVVDVINPANEEVVATIHSASPAQAEEALIAARDAFKTWSKTSLAERRVWVKKLGDAIAEHKEELLDLLVLETGKPYNQTPADYNMLTDSLTYFMEEAGRITGESIQDENAPGGTYHFCERRPLGVVVCHLAWNFPLLNIGYKLGPILASGCTCVMKPSSNTPLTALLLGKIMHDIDFPAGVVNFLSGPASEISSVLNASPIPRKVTLIGSSRTGVELMRQAATSIKTFSLELGGNGAAIVMPDADLHACAGYVTGLKSFNCGQVCTNINRAYVHADVYDAFVEECLAYNKEVVIGSGKEAGCNMGPMITKADQQRMLELVEDAVSKGAKIACGGKIPADRQKGYYFEPTVLTDCTEEMRVCREEIFGPILPVLRFTDLDRALELANDTEYGLTSYFYTKDLATAFKGAEALEAGTVFVNVAPAGDVGMAYPHSGVKNSGVGFDRSKYAMEEYYVTKHISLSPVG